MPFSLLDEQLFHATFIWHWSRGELACPEQNTNPIGSEVGHADSASASERSQMHR